MKSILVVDDEAVIREMLRDFLDQKYEVHTARNAREALSRPDLGQFSLVIADINMPGMKGYELLKEVRSRHPRVKVALITAYDIDNYIRLCNKYEISNIIAKTVPFNFKELSSVVDSLVTGEIFGLKKYMNDDFLELSHFYIKNSNDAREAPHNIAALFPQLDQKENDLKLVLTEIITNSLYHAPRDESGNEKYDSLEEVTLEPSEYIEILCGTDSEKHGISITDHSGNLKKETVIEKIERQTCGEGLFDLSGRGIYLSRCLADRMIINIKPGRKTEVILMYYSERGYMGYKPIYVNEL